MSSHSVAIVFVVAIILNLVLPKNMEAEHEPQAEVEMD